MCKVGNSFAKRDMSGRHVFYVDKILIELLLIVKRTPLPLLKFFLRRREDLLIEDEITHV
jgi:hypothetical protein